MIEIKTEMSKPIPAQEAKPAKPTGFSVTVDGYDVHWGRKGSMFCYTKDWMTSLTPDDIRKFAAILTEIANTLDIQEATNSQNLGGGGSAGGPHIG